MKLAIGRAETSGAISSSVACTNSSINTNNTTPVASVVMKNDTATATATTTTTTTATTTTTTCCYVTKEHSYAAQPLQLPDMTMIQHDNLQNTSSKSLNPDVCLKVKDISLTNDDRRILETGKMLTDKHINFAQRLLKLSFSKINCTVLQDKSQPQTPYKYCM